ncbi:MAG: hypothetical protein HY040_25590 [Planctomycetes bacterium]|nr:hypothetical protein [Planctomycetota bacterium]
MKRFVMAVIVLALLIGSNVGSAQNASAQDKALNFGALEPLSVEAARAKALAWLGEIGKTDAVTRERFDAIWRKNDNTVLDRVTETIVMADPAAAQLLAEARDPAIPAPTKVPDLLRSEKASAFYRANLGLAYARALSNRRVHEEALEVIKSVKAEQVVDPAAYLFHRAVAEHALLNKGEATKTIIRLLEDAASSPERYKTVGALMLLDMQAWKVKDLNSIARTMENIERRLDLARGGPHTQKLQKEVIARLDELIKELENKANRKKKPGGDGDGNDGECPDGDTDGNGKGKPGNRPTNPMQDSQLGGPGGSGNVEQVKNIKKLVDQWGRMPPRAREAALQELTQGMSGRHREAIENYFRNLALAGNKR